MYFSEYFLEAQDRIAKYKDKTIYQCEKYDKVGLCKLRFNLVSTNSKHHQAIRLSLRNFKGNIYKISGEKYHLPKVKNPCIDILQEDLQEGVELKIELVSGHILIYNATVEITDEYEILSCGIQGFALQIKELSPTKNRYYCNDYENDDDFDDLIFEMEILD